MSTLVKKFLLVFMMSILVVAGYAKDLSIKKDYPLTKLTKNVYVIHGPNEEISKQNQGFRNNPVIVTTSKGVVVVDPGSSVYTGEMVVRKIKTITDKPVVAVFDTHGHGDHWLGNDGIHRYYPKAKIYGDAKIIKAIESGDGDMWVKAINQRSEGAIEGTRVVVPDHTVKNNQKIKIGNITFKIYTVGKAHSDGDIMIEVMNEKVFIFGDILRVKNLSPFMASFSHNLKALELGEKRHAKIYIPGHGISGGRELIPEYRGFIIKLKSVIKKYFDEGLSDYEMKPQVIKALSEYKGWSGFDENIGRLVNLCYLEVESESF